MSILYDHLKANTDDYEGEDAFEEMHQEAIQRELTKLQKTPQDPNVKNMNTKIIRQKFVDMMYGQIPQNIWLEMRANPEYRIKLNATTIALLDAFVSMEGLTDYEARWLRDTWLY